MRYDVIVIGAGPAGLISAATVKKNYPEKSVLIIKKEKVGMIPCGIPYIFGTLGGTDKNVLPTKGVESLGVEILVDEVKEINVDSKTVKTHEKELTYEKLILATGSEPFVPPIPGKDLEGVYVISKYKTYLDKLYEKLREAKDVVIVGGGFIGVEVADEIRKTGKNVTVIELLDHLLPAAFDSEFGKLVEENLKKKGINVITGVKVKEIVGNGKVEKVILENGEVKTDIVILSTGYKPRTILAESAGLEIGKTGAIATDHYLETSVKDVYAVGDCAEHRCFLTGKPTKIMLASTATYDARIAGANLYEKRVLREIKGTIGVFSTSIEGLSLGSAGYNEEIAKKLGFDVVVGKAEAPDRHPGSFSDTSKITLKLIFSKKTGKLIGGEVAGGKSIGEMVNIIGLAIQKGVDAEELATMQIGTHPLLTSAPTVYPLVTAAEKVLLNL